MIDKEEKLLFDTLDPRSYRITLSEERYYNHIVSSDNHQAHNEYTPCEIKDCIEEPDMICQSESVESRDLYFGKKSSRYPMMYLRTVVEVDDVSKCGEVVTAHLTKNPKGGKDGGLRYVSIKSKL